MSESSNNCTERLKADIESHVDECVKDYAAHVDDVDVAAILRNIADRYDSEKSGEEELSIATADAMVPKTWDEICGQTEEDSLRL